MASGTDQRAFLPGGLKAQRIELAGDTVLIHGQAADGAAACPRCGEISLRIYSHYQRCLADLPAHGQQVRLVLNARRFRCRSPLCRTRIFVERLSQGLFNHTRGGPGAFKTWSAILISPWAGVPLRPWAHDCSCRSARTAWLCDCGRRLNL
jgi:hypothetical protein